VHGGLVDPVLRESMVLRVVLFTTGGIGIAAYVYRELFARFVVPAYDYTVAEVRRPTDATLEVRLEPARSPPAFRAGQFVFLAFGGELGWQRHPFSVASAASERQLEVAIKASGDYTRGLRGALGPGTPAKVVGPFGGFDYRQGGQEQIWIAGGIGVTPFMSWIRSLDEAFDRHVDFYYPLARETDTIYLDEVEAAGVRHPTFHPHVVYTDRDGLLTPEQAMGARLREDVWVYMCGPSPMMESFSRGFGRLGVAPSRVRWEEFAIR
jgi:predicted ferric reductase